MGHKVRFEANLVEYFIIKTEILNYVEGLEANNALMHQNYENITYDPDKKYVEFASYTDTTSGKVVCFEIRVFFGNFLETYNTQGWYAKSVSFNSSFTRNLDSGTTVNFGTPLGNEDEEDNTDSGDTINENINQALINAVGTPDKIYSAPNTSARFCTGQIFDWNGENAIFQANLVAYSSVKPAITEDFGKEELNAMLNQNYNNVTYDSTKTYIEVCYLKAVDSDEVFYYELRLVDSSYFNHSYTDWYAKSIKYNDFDDIGKSSSLKKTCDNPVIQQIIEIIGEAEIVYSDDKSVNGWLMDNGDTYYSSLAAFSSVSTKIQEEFDQITYSGGMQRGNYDNFSFADCNPQYTYIEIIYGIPAGSDNISYYELRRINESSFSDPDYNFTSKCIRFYNISELQDDNSL